MSKRLSAVFVAAIVLCLFAPGAALARGTVRLTGLDSGYTIVRGNNLTDWGQVVGNRNAADWSDHGAVQLQHRDDGKWKTISKIAPSKSGAFKFTLHKVAAGSYRVLFPGCEHYKASNRDFVVKYSPQLTMGALSMWSDVRASNIGRLWFALQARVASGLPAKYLTRGVLTYRSFASTDGVNFFPQIVDPASGISFGGSNSINMAPLLVRDTNTLEVDFIRSFKIQVYWSGNAYTAPGSVLSSAYEWD